MKAMILAGLLLLGAAPLAVANAEGNGPSFPGLQVPNVGVTTSYNGQGRIVVQEEHSSQPYDEVNAAPTHRLTPQQAHTWAMLDANSHGS